MALAFASVIASPISRKTLLLAGLCIEILATLALVWTKYREQWAPSMRRFSVALIDFVLSAIFFVARLIQTVCGMILWTIGYVKLADNMGTGNVQLASRRRLSAMDH